MYQTTREIGIDAAHRVTTHGSKCAHLHGHRYTVHVMVTGKLGSKEETGMTIDFGFLKKLMMELIDEPADHGLILWRGDPWLATFAPELEPIPEGETASGESLVRYGPFGKTWVIPCVPTAENLAALWFKLLWARVDQETKGRCHVAKVVVCETPNCSASFGGD